MIKHTKEELVIVTTTIKKFLIQQTINKIISEELEVKGMEIIGEEEFEDTDELLIENLKEAPYSL